MTINWKKVFIVLLPIVLSYLLVSSLISGHQFYWFDLAWRIAIILGIILRTKIRFNFSMLQWILLMLLIFVEVMLYSLLAKEMSLVRIAISILFAPLAEELLFRGWIMTQITGSNNQKIIISSILFSLYHLKNAYVLTPPALLYQLLFAGLIAGPILAWARLKYNSLFLPVILHSAAFNLLADTITPKLLPMIVKRNQSFSK